MSEKNTTFAYVFGEAPCLGGFLRKQEYSFHREVAQLVSVHVWGACGRQFESGLPDKEKQGRKCLSVLVYVFPQAIILTKGKSSC